jgi:sucrose-6-phosphate hydrolase SacC (GH32 family)
MVFRRASDQEASIRLLRAHMSEMPDYGHDYDVPIGALDELDLDIFVDNGLVELSADGGRVWATNLYFPDQPAGQVTLSVGDTSP